MKPERRSIGVHLRITGAKPQGDSLLGTLHDLQRLSRDEPGNRTFEILRYHDYAGGFLLIEEGANT